MNFSAPDLNALYTAAIRAVLTSGDVTSPRGMLTRELRAVTLELESPAHNVTTVRRLNYRFMVAEFLWILTGQTRVGLLSKFNGEMERFSDDGFHMAGAYGPPLVDQLPWVLNRLVEDRDSRQAIVTIWRPRPAGSKDVPCTIMLHFMVRHNQLELIVYMRSNDLWLGFPYDVFTFTMIQRYVASALGLRAGTYHHVVGSLHLYERNFRDAEATLADAHGPALRSPDLSFPWPHAALLALLTAPTWEGEKPGSGEWSWSWVIGMLCPNHTPLGWHDVLATHGIEPRWGR